MDVVHSCVNDLVEGVADCDVGVFSVLSFFCCAFCALPEEEDRDLFILNEYKFI